MYMYRLGFFLRHLSHLQRRMKTSKIKQVKQYYRTPQHSDLEFCRPQFFHLSFVHNDLSTVLENNKYKL